MNRFLATVLFVTLYVSVYAQQAYSDTLYIEDILISRIEEKLDLPQSTETPHKLEGYYITKDETRDILDTLGNGYGLRNDSGLLDLGGLGIQFNKCFIHPMVFFSSIILDELSFSSCESKTSSLTGPDNLPVLMDGRIAVYNSEIELFSVYDWSNDSKGNEVNIIELNNSKIGEIHIQGCHVWSLIIENCEVDKRLILTDCTIRDGMLIHDNYFGLSSGNPTDNSTVSDSIELNVFFRISNLGKPSTDLHFENNKLRAYSDSTEVWDQTTWTVKGKQEIKVNHIQFEGEFKNLILKRNVFDGIVEFFQTDVEGEFNANSNIFKQYISLSGLLFSEKRNFIHWSQLEGEKLISITRDLVSIGTPVGASYSESINLGHREQDIADSLGFFSIQANYKSLFEIYKRNNETESANGCYAEMKQVETRRWKYLYEQDKSFESFFRWQLNAFLSYFTDYGTNPAKAVIKSGWVILLFAIFYLFFPSDWDVTNRSQLMAKTKDLFNKNREKTLWWTLGFVCYSGFIHIMNALTLSLNAFTTLGFGDIPTHGAARYVTIVQGFIGWFLLTIFSVSLINQVLG